MNEEIYILFENYLNQKMAVEEKLEFEKQLKSDLAFAEKFEIYKTTSSFLTHKFSKETSEFKMNLEYISKQNFSDLYENPSKVIRLKPWYFAAAASILLFLSIWILQSANPQYSDFNQHEPAYFNERGTQSEKLFLAQDAFNAKNFKKAQVLFKEILKTSNSAEIRYFYAITLLETNSFTEAESIFKQLNQGASIYKDKALWYLALSKLKQKQYDDCRILLESVSIDSEDYDKAKELLREL